MGHADDHLERLEGREGHVARGRQSNFSASRVVLVKLLKPCTAPYALLQATCFSRAHISWLKSAQYSDFTTVPRNTVFASSAYHVRHVADTATATCTATGTTVTSTSTPTRTRSARSYPHEAHSGARRAVWPNGCKLSEAITDAGCRSAFFPQ